MDTKQAADSLAFFEAELGHIRDVHNSDFMYFTNWVSDLDKQMRALEKTVLKFEKTKQFSDILQETLSNNTPEVITKGLSTKKIIVVTGVVFIAGAYVGHRIAKSKKGSKNA